MTGRRRSARGFSLIELVIASTLLILVLSGMSVVVANSERALLETRLRDTAAALGVSLSEKAAAFNCGTAVNPASALTLEASTRCAKVYGGTPAPADVRFSSQDANGRTFTVEVSTRWKQTGAGDACYAETGVDSSQLLRPALLERTVALSYQMAGNQRSKTIVSVQATPDSSAYLGEGSGGIVIRAPAGTLTTINTPDGTPISRFSAECSPEPAAYFPFLPPGEYLVGQDGSASQPVTVTAGNVTRVGGT